MDKTKKLNKDVRTPSFLFKASDISTLKFSCGREQVVDIDLFASDFNFNVSVVGGTREDRALLSRALSRSHSQDYAKTLVIGNGDILKENCEAFGGEYIKITKNSDFCLNFFSNIQVTKVFLSDLEDENIRVGSLSFLASSLAKEGEDFFLKPFEDEYPTIIYSLISLLGKSKDEDFDMRYKILRDSLDIAFYKKRFDAGVYEVIQAVVAQEEAYREQDQMEFACLCQEIIRLLEPYNGAPSEFFGLLNGVCSLNFSSNHIVVDCSDFEKDDDTLYSVIVMLILNRYVQEFSRDRFIGKNIAIIEDATLLLKDSTISKSLEYMGRGFRKHNGSLVLMAQDMMSFTCNSSALCIFEIFCHKFFLSLKEYEIKDIVERYDLNTKELEWLKDRESNSVKTIYRYLTNSIPLICRENEV